MKYRRLCMFLLLFACLFTLVLPAGAANSSDSKGYRLLIYYGIPAGVNEVWDDTKAAEVFAEYDVLVFGAGLEENKHSYHDSTAEIFRLIREKNPDARLFGYVDLGVTTSNFSPAAMESKAKKWKALGANGIFLDDAGYDYGVSRARLNQTVNAVHRLGMSVFVNAWNPDDVMGNKVDRKYNPKGQASALDKRDIYLLEDFLQPTDITKKSSPSVFNSAFRGKMDKSLAYRKKLGVKLMSVSIIDYAKYSENAVRKFFRMNEATAAVFSLDAYGIAPTHYSSERPNKHKVRSFPYILNYMSYYSTNVEYVSKYGNRDFSRGGFRIHSLPGEHYYNYPADAKS